MLKKAKDLVVDLVTANLELVLIQVGVQRYDRLRYFNVILER